MRQKRCFSLFEVMVAIFILTLAAGAIGWNMHQMIARKRFTASVERLRSRLFTCRRLALNCQGDWRCALNWNGTGWVLESRSLDSPDSFFLPDLNLGSLLLTLDGEKRGSLALDFTATGEVLPKGILQIQTPNKDAKIEWKFPDMFLLEEGTKSGPVHP